MDKLFEVSLFNRKVFAKLLNELSHQQLAKIPPQYNNSIFWNIAHVVVTQQLLFYKLSGSEMVLDEEFMNRYKKGTVPTEKVDAKDIELVKQHMLPLLNKAKEDYHSGKFSSFQSYPTSANIILNSIEDAIQFNAFHEGIHLGSILSLKKLV